jgi:hypothetical protein
MPTNAPTESMLRTRASTSLGTIACIVASQAVLLTPMPNPSICGITAYRVSPAPRKGSAHRERDDRRKFPGAVPRRARYPRIVEAR